VSAELAEDVQAEPVDTEGNSSGEDQTGQGSAAAPSDTSLPIRERILAYVKTQTEGRGEEILITTKAIGEALEINPNNVTYHLNKLVAIGALTTRNAGPRGTYIRLGGGSEVARRRGRRARAESGSVSAAPAPAAAATAPATETAGKLNYCPYCGGKVLAADWRYCAGCGRPLA